jgi:hypothetical protein
LLVLEDKSFLKKALKTRSGSLNGFKSEAVMEHTQLTALININTIIIKLNEKIDTLLKIKLSEPVKGIPTEPALNCRNPNHIWSIEFVDDLFLIKYNYDKDFAEVVKMYYLCDFHIKMRWDKELLGWVAHNDFHENMFFKLSNSFPEWKCIDKR